MPDLNSDTELREAIELLYFGYRSFTAGPDKILAELGLGRVHHRILYFVARNDRISVTALLAILDVSKQALNAPLRHLLNQGFVTNQPSKADRRVKELRLSPEGRRLEKRLTNTQMAQLKQVFDAAGPRAQSGWRTVMENLKN